jgi:succinyl-diaminopimelate desuccinylase
LFDRPSINLGRIHGGDALNKVPDLCTMAVDVRYLPGQDPAEILAQVGEIDGIKVTRTFIYPPVTVARTDPYVRALRDAVTRSTRGEVMSVGRDGASDAASFIEADEWVSLSSLARYRRALADFVRGLPIWLEEARGADVGLRAVDGELA